jgi:hypothetical protein
VLPHEGASNRSTIDGVIRPIAVAIVCTAVSFGAPAMLSKADAAKFQAKLAQIERYGAQPRRGKTPPHATQVSDVELNSYLKFLAGAQVPVGIADPLLHAAGDGRVTGEASVDLDAVRTQKKRAWTDPLAYLMGRLPVTAAGMLTTQNGVGRFQLESAQISGLSIPKSLLQELLTYYSKSAEHPNGINMDDPFQLPAAIQEIRIGQGVATIVQ